MLPRGFDRLGNVFTAAMTVGTDPQFNMSGGGLFANGTVQFNDFMLTFEVPNDERPGVTTAYSIANPSLVGLGTQTRYEQHLVHQNIGGQTTVSNTVAVDGLASVTGHAGVIVGDMPPLPGGPIILEMALAPQQDWNDSSGGNGRPFDSVPGSGTVDGNDVWIEVSGGTTGTQSWRVELRDATGATFARTLGPPTVTSQTRVLSGFNVGTAPIDRVRLIDQNGLVRQLLDITLIESALGPATDPSNETLTFSIYGSPTSILQGFVRRPATINLFSPF